MTVKELLEIGRRIHHQSSGIPRERLCIAVTQHERDAVKEYMERVHMLPLNSIGKSEKLKICGILLVVTL